MNLEVAWQLAPWFELTLGGNSGLGLRASI
jgi:hypothetical protein